MYITIYNNFTLFNYFQQCAPRVAKVSTPEKEKHAFVSDHRADTTPVIISNNAEGEKISDFNDSLQQQHDEDAGEEAECISLINLDGSKRGTSRKQHWKSQSMGDTVQQAANSLQTSNTVSLQEEESQEQPTFSANRELWQRRATSQTQLNPPAPPNHNKIFRTSQEFREMRQKHTPDLVMDLPLSAQDASKKSASSSSLSSSDEETPTQPTRAEAATSPTGGPESPDMSTAAERFAKQNQCTLKKNTKSNSDASKLKRMETEHDPEQESEEIVRSTSSNQISDSMPLRSPLPPRSTPKIIAKFADMHLTGGSQVSSFKPQIKVKPTILKKPVLPFPHPHMSPELARKIEKQAQSAEQTN